MAKIILKLSKDEQDVLRTYRIFDTRSKQVILNYFRAYYHQEKHKK